MFLLFRDRGAGDLFFEAGGALWWWKPDPLWCQQLVGLVATFDMPGQAQGPDS